MAPHSLERADEGAVAAATAATARDASGAGAPVRDAGRALRGERAGKAARRGGLGEGPLQGMGPVRAWMDPVLAMGPAQEEGFCGSAAPAATATATPPAGRRRRRRSRRPPSARARCAGPLP